MKKVPNTFSIEMMNLVREKELDYLFAGEGGQVLSTTRMLQLILNMEEGELIWQSLIGKPYEQESAIIRVKDHLIKKNFNVSYEFNSLFFYLIITK